MPIFNQGNILTHGEDKIKVLGVVGEAVLTSRCNQFQQGGGVNTEKELLDLGWKKEGEEWQPRINEKYYVPAPTYKEKYVVGFWGDSLANDTIFGIKNLIYKTKEEAIAVAERMLEVLK